MPPWTNFPRVRAFLRLTAASVAVPVMLAAPMAHAAAPLPPTPPAQAAFARIDGFRSARFGLSEPDVRRAIAADFRLSGAAIVATENPVQRTPVLRVRTADLIPGGGTAQIDYIFGYRSHALIEVNILWSAATDAATTPARLVANGAALQAYFLREAFPPAQTVLNALLPDGNVMLFRAQDESGHAVVLVISGKRDKLAASGSARLTPTALTLVYAADPAHPDVFQLKKGSF
jgi:hypothetical protein